MRLADLGPWFVSSNEMKDEYVREKKALEKTRKRCSVWGNVQVELKLGLETQGSPMPRFVPKHIPKKKHPTKPLQTTRLFAKLGSVLLACVFEIFYSSCIRLPGDLPISHAAQCTILPLFASLLVWQQVLLMWCAWPKMCHRCRRVSEKRLWSLSDKFHMSAWGRGNMSRSSNQQGGRGSRDADYLTAVGAGSALGVLCLGMLLGAFWQKNTYTAPFLK